MHILLMSGIGRFGMQIGHNGIRESFKGQGYGHIKLEEALRRIREYVAQK